MSERSGIPEELLYCVKLNYHKILTMVNMNAPVKRISDLYEYYVYEVLSQEAIAPDVPNAPNAPNAAGKEEEKTPADTDVGEFVFIVVLFFLAVWLLFALLVMLLT